MTTKTAMTISKETGLALPANNSRGRLHFIANRGGQASFLALRASQRHSYYLVMGGIGSGKSTVVAYDAAKFAHTHPGSVSMVVAPTYNMMAAATLPSVMQWIPKQTIERWNKSEWHLTLTNGAEIWFRNASNPDSLRGPNLHHLAIDEGALLSYDAWLILIGRTRLPGAYVTMATTPRGRNWLYDVFVRNATADHALMRMPTRENRRNLRSGFIRELQAAYSGDYARQELEGEFISYEGLVYRQFAQERHTFSPDVAQDWIDAGMFARYVVGVDWGWANPGVMNVFGVDHDDRMRQLEEHYQRQMLITAEGDQDSWVRRLLDIDARYGNQTIYVCDPSQPVNINTFRRALGEPEDYPQTRVIGAINDIIPGVSEVAARLEQRGDGSYGLMVSSDAANTLAEYEQYHYPDAQAGRNGRELPVAALNHAMDATRYVAMYLANRVERHQQRVVMRPQVAFSRGGF